MVILNMDKKNILFLDHAPFVGGAQKILLAHIGHLASSGFLPIVALGPNSYLEKKYSELGVGVIVIQFNQLKKFSPATIFYFIYDLWKISKIIRENQVDLVCTNTVRTHITGSLAAKLTGRKVIWFLRDYTFPVNLVRILKPMVDYSICVSVAIAKYYFGGGWQNKKIEVIYVATDIKKKLDNLSDQDIIYAKEKFNITDDDFVVGYVGRLIKWKGAQVLIEAAKILHEQNKNIKVIIAGSDDGQGEPWQAYLERLINKNNLSRYVKLVGWQEDVSLIYKCLDCFVLTSIEAEPYATSTIEAMMARVPVVGTNIGGTSEAIHDKQTGLLVKPNDVQELAAAINFIAKNKTKAGQMAQKAYDQVVKYNQESYATEHLLKIYDQLLT